MKKITTVLPVYDSVNKITYNRVMRSNPNNVENHCVATPRFKLPSMQWNVESDDPGLITRIEILDEKGIKAKNVYGLAHWNYAEWYNRTMVTFAFSGVNITSAIGAGGAARVAQTNNFMGYNGETIVIKGTLTINSGSAPQIRLYDYLGNFIDSETLVSGYNAVTFTFTSDTSYYLDICNVNMADSLNFSFTSASVETTNFLNHFWDGSNIVYDYTDNGYDTFFQIASGTPNFTVEKTTAAGEASVTGVWSISDFDTYTSKRIRIDCYLTLISGTAPKVELRDAATGLVVHSNTVQLVAGRNTFILTPTLNTGAHTVVMIYNGDTETCAYTLNFAEGIVNVYEPKLYTNLTDDYFQYNGETLAQLLPTGKYYLKMTSLNGFVYYSEYFNVDCVYENQINDIDSITSSYDTFISILTTITSAINAGGAAYAWSSTFPVEKGEKIILIFNLKLISGELPIVNIDDLGGLGGISNFVTFSNGLNYIELTSTGSSNTARIRIYNTAASNFSTSEILVIREYSEEYLTFNYSNTCDLGDIVYQNGLTQTLYLKSETMEPSFELDDEGQKNGDGRFIRTFARQVKKYTARTLELPEYIIEVLNRMKLHNTVELIDTVGNENTVYNLEVDHEWLFDDKYYAKVDLTFDYEEAFIVSSCCVNIT